MSNLTNHGAEVRSLQRSLRRLGYDIAAIERRAEAFGPTTELAVRRFQETAALPITGSVDERTQAALVAKLAATPLPVSFVVRGTVRRTDGSPVAGARMQAADVDLRTEQILGEAQTNTNGHYEIHFDRGKFARAEADGPDLQVRVLGAAPSTAVDVVAVPSKVPVALASSPIVFNAPADAIVDLVIPGPAAHALSEWERLGAALQPVLRGIAPRNLTASDIEFLTNEIDYESSWISLYALAWRYSGVVTAAPTAVSVPSATGAAPPAAYYGLFREGMPTQLSRLLSRDPGDLRRALVAAIREAIIPAAVEPDLDRVLAALHMPVVHDALVPPADHAIATVGAVVANVLPARAHQEAFLTAYLRHRGPPAAFWPALLQEPGFTAKMVDDLQHAFWFRAFARDHAPLVSALQALRARGAIKTPRDLATKDEAWWRSLVGGAAAGSRSVGVPANVPGADADAKVGNYVRTLMRTLAVAFPTTVIATRLAADRVPQHHDLDRFFANSPEFELGRDHVDAYLEQHPTALRGVEDAAQLRRRLKGVQRVFKLTPRYDEMRVLLAAGLDSARGVARVDKAQFVATHGNALGGDTRAADLHDRATQISAAAVLVFAKFSPTVNQIGTRVTPRLS